VLLGVEGEECLLVELEQVLGVAVVGEDGLEEQAAWEAAYMKWQMTPKEKTSEECETIILPLEALRTSGAM
jgi:hypothetical protein